MIWFWIILKNIILNPIKRYNFELYKKNIFKILMALISSLSFVNKSLTISMFSFSTAKYNAVLQNLIISKLHQKTWFWISLKNMILNPIEWYDFEFHWKIWFWIVLKDMVLNLIERYDFEFHLNTWLWILSNDMILNYIEKYYSESN